MPIRRFVAGIRYGSQNRIERIESVSTHAPDSVRRVRTTNAYLNGEKLRESYVRAYVLARGATDGRNDRSIAVDFYAGNKIDPRGN